MPRRVVVSGVRPAASSSRLPWQGWGLPDRPGNQRVLGSIVGRQVEQDAGRQAGGRGMRLLSTVSRAELVAPVVQRNIGVWVGLALIVVIVGLDIVGGRNAELLGLLVSPPIVAASFVGPNRTVAVGVVALGAAVGYGRAVGVDLLAGSQGVPAVAIVAATVLSGLVARVRVEREGRLRAVTRVAEVAQRALLGGVPPALGSLHLAVLSPRPAWKPRLGGLLRGGGDPPRVRLLVGDVRGKGLDAVRLAGVVLGSFRDAAQDRPDLAQVVAALDRSVTRAIGLEDFVTAVVVQVAADGSAIVLNCGHPAPLLVRAGRATELDPPEPAPPLGLGPRPEPLRLRLALGDRILLYTDGPARRAPAAGSSRCRPRRRSRWSPPTSKRGWRRCGPSCNATSLASSTTTSPCCSSNAAADGTPLGWGWPSRSRCSPPGLRTQRLVGYGETVAVRRLDERCRTAAAVG
jgi:phosphoserine phosphatase RsbU/P